MNIKPLFDVSFIKSHFWRGFAEVWTHTVWLFPLAIVAGHIVGTMIR